MAEFEKDDLIPTFKRLENILAKNGTGYFVGKKASELFTLSINFCINANDKAFFWDQICLPLNNLVKFDQNREQNRITFGYFAVDRSRSGHVMHFWIVQFGIPELGSWVNTIEPIQGTYYGFAEHQKLDRNKT